MLPEPRTDDRIVVDRLLSAVIRRRWMQQAALAAAVGSIAAALALAGAYAAGWDRQAVVLQIAAGLILGAAALAISSPRTTSRTAAAAIERVRPCRNLVVTLEELDREPDRTTARMTKRVRAEAALALAGVRGRDVIPLGRTMAAASVAIAASFMATPTFHTGLRDQLTATSVGADAPRRAGSIRVVVEPPAYSGKPATTMTDPERIDALEGSRIRFDVPADMRVRFGTAAPAVELVARTSGYFAVEPVGGEAGRRLIPLNVIPDRAPLVRIDAPARDLLLPDGRRPIPISVFASDDLALRTLELRYTKVSGTGEQFEFVEGSLPVTLQRPSGREWRAGTTLALASLKLGPGDSIVYRAVARDGRPGDAGLAASDTYFVEIAGPGQVALEGVEMPPELERYAMSQQMIVMKLERLRAKEPTIARDALVEETASIAAEQRTVRANFVFLLGGHVEDEEVEAEQSHEIQEGRLENTARKDISAAIAHMTRAEQGLSAVSVSGALPPARAAVEALQRAFGRSRYLLRSLAVRSRLDPSRRLTGDVQDARTWRRTAAEPTPGEEVAARQLFDDLLQLAQGLPAGGAPDARRRQELAEAALAIDPSSSVWQEVSRRLLAAGSTTQLAEVIAQVSAQALKGAVPRGVLADPESPLVRAFKAERPK